jgi:hypothetical protein
MTILKIIGNPASGAMQALEPHVARMYAVPGLRMMAIIEMAHVERVQPAPGADGTPTVRMKITGCEVPNREQEGTVREAQRALFLARTARGTLDEEGMLQLDEATLKLTPGLLMSIECARLRAGLNHWEQQARRIVAAAGKLTGTEIAHELQAVADGLTAVLDQAAIPDENEED